LPTYRIDSSSNITLNAIITPGCIDTHIHYRKRHDRPSYGGEQLPTWLNTYTFPKEQIRGTKHMPVTLPIDF